MTLLAVNEKALKSSPPYKQQFGYVSIGESVTRSVSQDVFYIFRFKIINKLQSFVRWGEGRGTIDVCKVSSFLMRFMFMFHFVLNKALILNSAQFPIFRPQKQSKGAESQKLCRSIVTCKCVQGFLQTHIYASARKGSVIAQIYFVFLYQKYTILIKMYKLLQLTPVNMIPTLACI